MEFADFYHTPLTISRLCLALVFPHLFLVLVLLVHRFIVVTSLGVAILAHTNYHSQRLDLTRGKCVGYPYIEQ